MLPCEDEVRLHGALDGLLDLGVGGVDQVAHPPADRLLPIRQGVDVDVDARILRIGQVPHKAIRERPVRALPLFGCCGRSRNHHRLDQRGPLAPALPEHRVRALGDLSADVVVVDNDSQTAPADAGRDRVPGARVVPSANHGFSHANNRGADDLRRALRAVPQPGHRDRRRAPSRSSCGRWTSARRSASSACARSTPRAAWTRRSGAFRTRCARSATRSRPSACRAVRAGSASASSTEPSTTARSTCDWTSGSFMLARREAIESAGFLDERFFMYSDETDLCRRIKTAGWEIRHLPVDDDPPPRGQGRRSSRASRASAPTRASSYARKHFSPVHRRAVLRRGLLRHSLRSRVRGSRRAGRRAAAA